MGAEPATGQAMHEGTIGRVPWRNALLPMAVLAVVLGGCGQTESNAPESPTPAATVAPTDNPAETPLLPAGSTGPATPGSSPVTFGGLADRIDAAWRNVRSYRAEFQATSPATPPLTPAAVAVDATPAAAIGATPGPVATPVTASPFVVVREVVLPDRQRQTLTGSGADDHEAIVLAETLYLRGPLAQEILPGASDDVWVSLPLSALSPESEAGRVLAGLAVIPTSPMAGLRAGLRPQELRDLGPIEIEGRSCTAYGGADTTAIGTRRDITVAVDAEGLPCSIETRVGTDLVSRTVYGDFNAPIAIEAPAAATPVAGMLPAATPAARD